MQKQPINRIQAKKPEEYLDKAFWDDVIIYVKANNDSLSIQKYLKWAFTEYGMIEKYARWNMMAMIDRGLIHLDRLMHLTTERKNQWW